MAKSIEEIIAENQAERQADQKAQQAKEADRSGAPVTGITKFLSTVSGGYADYLDLLVRRQRGEKIDSVDQLRAKYNEDYEANPMSAMAGGIAGTAAQALPIGRGLQAVGALGKAVPGIVGGLRTGATVGAATGAANEAAHQADRLFSDKSAAEDYSGWGSVGRIGKEAVAGAAGGALGGIAGNLFTKGRGMIANMAEAPSERVIQAALREANDAARLGAGKLGPEQALRAIRNPALHQEGSDLAAAFEGRMAEAGKGYTGGVVPKADSRAAYQSGVQNRLGQEAADAADVARIAGTDAATAKTAEATAKTNLAASHEGLRGTPLDTPAFWALQGDPSLKAVTKQLLEADRGRFAGKLTGAPHDYSKADAAKLVNARYPSNTYGRVEQAATADPTVAGSAEKVMRMQNPAFQAADDATTALGKAQADMARAEATALSKHAQRTELDDILSNAGRAIAQKPPPVGANLPSLSPTKWAIQAAKAGHDVLAGKAIKNSTDRMIGDPLEEILRQVGKRTGVQRYTEPGVYSVLSGLLSGATQ
jgi:hypothetical protein